jgi:hypothetical protein
LPAARAYGGRDMLDVTGRLTPPMDAVPGLWSGGFK